MLVASFLCDSLYYGKFTWTQYNFLYVNIVQDISAEFGIESHVFYLHELDGAL